MVIQTHPFKRIPHHGQLRQDFFAWIPTWMAISSGELDLTKPEHVKHMALGRAILSFQTAISPTTGTVRQMQDYLYMEEIWPFKKSQGREDILTNKFGCLRFYSLKPSVYSVIEVRRILGLAPITLDPLHQILPRNALPRSALEREQNYSFARADTSSGVGDGSAFWILKWWALLWGSQKPCSSGETMFTK